MISQDLTNFYYFNGALTSNRKGGDDFFTLNYKIPASNVDPHISKKPRLSMNQTTQDHNKTSTATWLFIKYPFSITPIKREIRAPRKRPSSSRFGGGSHLIMGRFLNQQLYRAKSGAFKTFRYLKKKDKQVVKNVDGDDEDLHVEELGTGVVPKTGLFDGSGQIRKESNAKTVLSNGSGGRWKVSDGVIEILDNSDDGVVTDVRLQSSSVVTVSDDDVNLLKVENAEKMMDSLSLSNSKFDDSSSSASFVPSYKKLLDSAEKRNDNLKSLQFCIQYNEKLLETYKLLRPQKKDEQYVKEDVITEHFVQLDKEEKAEISHALSNYSRRKVLVTHENSNIDITGEILQCLRPGAWLNDEVINVYLELLKEREKREPKRFLRCHFFNTFFYKKLISGTGGYNYQCVKRWTSQRKLGYCLFECDKIFVPIHQEVHWCLAVINKKDEKFQYLDSLGGRDNQVLRVLSRYFIDEVKDKNGKDIDVSSWKQEFVVDLPEQENGFDCGMFMLKYADFYSRDIGLCFNQEHMPYFRLRTAKEILRLKAE